MLIDLFGTNITHNEILEESSIGTPNTRGNQFLRDQLRIVIEQNLLSN